MAETGVATQLTQFRMPSLGSDMDSGTVIGWRVAVGDDIARGDVLADVDTDKSEIEVEVWHDGVVAEILVQPGTEVPVGTPLALIAPPGTEPAPAAEPTSAVSSVDDQGSPDGDRTAPAPPVRAPAARKGPAAPPLEQNAGLLATPRTVYWPSPDGAATSSRRPGPATAPTETGPTGGSEGRVDRMRTVIANLMSRANAEIPHYHLVADVDLGATMDWLEAENAARPVTDRLLPAAVLIKAVATATAANPELNGAWVDGGFEPAGEVNIGVAVHLRQGGLVAPAIMAADQLSIDELMERLRDIVTRARSGKLRSAEMTAGTLTVTNLGDQGSDAVLGVIYPPQVALVGFGRVTDRPMALDGEVAIRPTVTITLAADHRATDGHSGARLLNAIDDLLQHPEAL